MNVLLACNAEQPLSLHRDLQPSGDYNDGAQDWYLYLCTEVIDADRVIGVWNPDGSVALDEQDQPISIHADYEAFIRPMGNDAGAATDSLDFHHWLGGGQRHVQAEPVAGTLPQYPADRQPYVVKVERTVITDDDYPATPHGFKFTIEFADPSRDPGVRTFGVYSDAECTQYLWTVGGAFQEVDSGEVDENGDPILVWSVQCPVSQRTAEPEEFHFAMLYASLQEGHFTLRADQQTVTLNFFNVNQGESAGGGVIEWAPGQAVAVDDLRTYEGSTYSCLQAHTTQAGWTPPAVPALWVLV